MKISIALSLVHFVLFEFKSAAECVILQNNNDYPDTNLGNYFFVFLNPKHSCDHHYLLGIIESQMNFRYSLKFSFAGSRSAAGVVKSSNPGEIAFSHWSRAGLH